MQREKERREMEAARLSVPPLDTFHKKPRPLLDAAPGHWVISKENDKYKGVPGFVQSVDDVKQLLKVDFSFGQSKAVRVSYKEKGLKWSRPEVIELDPSKLQTEKSGSSLSSTEEQRKIASFKGIDEALSSESPATQVNESTPLTNGASSEVTENEDHFTDKPAIHEAPGCLVKVEGIEDMGLVDTVSKTQGTMNVLFEDESSGRIITKKVDYNDPNINWLVDQDGCDSTAEDENPLDNVVEEGNEVEDNDIDDESVGSINMDIFASTTCPDEATPINGNYFILVPGEGDDDEDEIGKVLRLDFKNGMASVQFITSAPRAEAIQYDSDIEDVPFMAREIKWLELPL